MTDSKSERGRLPFEPRQKKQKTPKRSPIASQTAEKTATRASRSVFAGIPDSVSQRMVRRMALFSGIPTALGMSSFVVAYWVVSHQWFALPTGAVLLVSLGFFGLGVFGLSYGLFSTSWDEQHSGSWWGWQEFKENFGRTVSGWRSAKKEAGGN
jgi:VIT1/CCC1 family predicted Fe2+/Mn2+ transporter